MTESRPTLALERVKNEAYLDAAIDSPHTRRAYERHLSNAFAGLGVASVSEVSGAELARYRAAVVSSDLAPDSQAHALAALRSFLSWSRTLGAHRLSSDVIRTALKTPKAVVRRPYRTLGESDIATVLRTASTARDRALLAVLLGAGLRAAEAVGLDVIDLDDDPEGGLVIAVRRGKGRMDRQVPVQPDVSRLLLAYLAETGRRRHGVAELPEALNVVAPEPRHPGGGGERGPGARPRASGFGRYIDVRSIVPHSAASRPQPKSAPPPP
jgi:site-specific recombinase XerD